MPILRIKVPGKGDETHVLSGQRVTIGRRPDNTIQILDPSVSAHHAEFVPANGHYRLHDLESTNLSCVDGNPITDFHLHAICKVAFGNVQCEFDPAAESESTEPRLSPEQLEKDMAFLRSENADLVGKIHSLERQIDILSSARLVTRKADTTPFSDTTKALKEMTEERDEFRHMSVGLKLELEKLRDELAQTVQERDAARQAAELLQAEKAALLREQKPAAKRAEVRLPVSESAATQKLGPPLPAPFDQLPKPLKHMRAAIDRLGNDPADAEAREALDKHTRQFVENTAAIGEHAITRMAGSVEGLVLDLVGRAEPADASMIRTLAQAAEFMATLLDPPNIERGKKLPPPTAIAVDDDADLLATITTSLELAHVQPTGCGTGEEALGHMLSKKFDLVLLDAGLPGINGTQVCARARELAGYRKTPIVFITVANTVEKRAETSLNGGNDFLAKPFNVFELTVKAHTWILRNQLGLL